METARKPAPMGHGVARAELLTVIVPYLLTVVVVSFARVGVAEARRKGGKDQELREWRVECKGKTCSQLPALM